MDTFIDFYQSSDYAGFDQNVRKGGTFGLSFLDAQQDAIETDDPPLPEVPFVAGISRGGPAEVDFGDGWRKQEIAPGFVDIQPALQSCHFRIPALHLRIVFTPEHRLRAALDERGVSMSALDAFSATFQQSPRAFAAISEMCSLSAVNDSAANLAIDGLWLQMLGTLLLEADPALRLRPASAIGDKRLSRVLDFIETHLSEPLCVADLASVACLSTTQFSRSFKAATGQTPARYVLERRCVKADDLLSYTGQSLTPIALDCGFENTSYFWTLYRRLRGYTPAARRNRA